ncbi:ANTAR domain-containing protein [Pseudonocardia sp.]|uniref:ANTAR domain-containing protein n=1 Tax=Pseudonocardia sp. TaxID=60912 RepID=UPI002604A162|nr:ANTAR domain-containing protein [Pseudonocardia sp.]MCW2717092.1 uncharacterized protein [Pseudonocardia sp.]
MRRRCRRERGKRVVIPARRLAGQTTIAVTAGLRHYDEIALTDGLRLALSSRSIIGHAIGSVIARRRCPADEAFATLRTVSQRRNITLRTIAENLVAAPSRGTQPSTI